MTISTRRCVKVDSGQLTEEGRRRGGEEEDPVCGGGEGGAEEEQKRKMPLGGRCEPCGTTGVSLDRRRNAMLVLSYPGSWSIVF